MLSSNQVERARKAHLRARRGLAAALALAALSGPAAAQCPDVDRPVLLKFSLSAGRSETLVTQRIPICVLHEYRLALRAGQRIEISLTSPSDQRDMLTVFAPSGEKPVDGGTAWSATVATSGTYRLEIGTDVTTSYTLKISVR